MDKNSEFDSPSFWSGIFLGFLILALLFFVGTLIDGYQYFIGVPDACQYAEDLCYPEYEDGRWSIVEGER